MKNSPPLIVALDVNTLAEVRELMEFPENTAGGMMTTEYISLPQNAAVADAVRALRGNEEMLESVNTLFLVDADGRLRGSVALARLFAASDNTPLEQLATELLVRVSVKEKQDRVTELFDKYNLLTLPVVDEDGYLSGVITADDIITVLRQR